MDREAKIQEFLDLMARSMSNLDQIQSSIDEQRTVLDEQQDTIDKLRAKWREMKKEIDKE
jgi:septal ring factor EnvC (AmiA/AmiB activator)